MSGLVASHANEVFEVCSRHAALQSGVMIALLQVAGPISYIDLLLSVNLLNSKHVK